MTARKMVVDPKVRKSYAKLEPLLTIIENAILEAKKTALGGLVSGELYVRLRETLGVSLDQYNCLIALVISRGKVENRNHLLRAIAIDQADEP